MNDSHREFIRKMILWGVIYGVVGAAVGYFFFADTIYGYDVPTAQGKILLGAAIGFGGTVITMLSRYWSASSNLMEDGRE